jgi:hypothetical protein
MKKKTASCFGVRKGGIRRNARIRVAGPVDMGIDFCALAAEVGKFVSAEEPCQERPPIKSEDRGTMRNARISVARPVDLGIDPDMLAAEVAEFVAAAERRQPCKSEDDGAMMRGARISVARPVDLIDPGLIEAGLAELLASAERRQAGQRAKRAMRPGKRDSGAHGRRRRVAS